MCSVIANRLGILTIVVFLLLFAAICSGTELVVHFIDVGQGDAIFIQSPGANILVDGGGRSHNRLPGYLHEYGIEQLDLVISTHPHTDHIGGLLAVLGNIRVDAVFDSGRAYSTQTYAEYLLLILEYNIPFTVPRRGEEYNVCDLELYFLHPGANVKAYSPNNASLVFRLVFGDISILFTGDLEISGEVEVLDSGLAMDALMLKVGHHGSRTSSSPAFLDAVNPKYAVIQAGEGNPYEHPHLETLTALSERSIQVYRTDHHGDIIIRTDGTTYSIEISHEVRPRAPPEGASVNINTANKEELQKIPGVGPVIADRIIKYREGHGLFQAKEEIMKVAGIGETWFIIIEDLIKLR